MMKIKEYEIKEITVKTQEPYRTLFEKILLQKKLYQDFLIIKKKKMTK